MSKTGKNLAVFNCKNGVYAIDDTVYDLNYLTNFSKDSNSSLKELYGDGELQYSAPNDKGFTGTLGLMARDIEYEVALGMAQNIDGGVSEVEMLSTVSHPIGLEVYAIIDGVTKAKKIWFFGVQTSRPTESLAQNTEEINESTVDYPITIKGVKLKAADGVTDYVDENGLTKYVWSYSKMPTDDGYDTFLASVPVPKMPA